MMSEPFERSGHAVLDLPSRDFKARKIARLQGLDRNGSHKRMFEIGCGPGDISHWYGSAGTTGWDVGVVDVEYVRLVRDGYASHTVEGTMLPFDDASFDVVISNHEIEHVGDEGVQPEHLREIRRVIKPDGIDCLAVPNWRMLTEPYYWLMFLRWWPCCWRTPYLRLCRKGNFNDCEPMEMHELECMLAAARLGYRNLCIEAWRETFEIEQPRVRAMRLLRSIPDSLLKPLQRIIPAMICRIEPARP